MAKPMPICKGDGSKEDGDISGISGLGASGSGDFSTTKVWNGESCNIEATAKAKVRDDEKALENDIIGYMRSPSTKTSEIV